MTSTTSTTTLVREGVSLRAQVGRLVLGVVVLLALVQGAVSLLLYSRALDQQLELQARAHVQALVSDGQLQVGVWAGNEKIVLGRLDGAIGGNGELAFAAIVVDGKIAGVAVAPQANLDVIKLRAAVALYDPKTNGGTLLERMHVAQAPVVDKSAEIIPDDLGLGEPGEAAAPKEKGRNAVAIVGVDRSAKRELLIEHAATSGGIGLAAALLASLLVGRAFAPLFRRMRRVRETAETLATGDLRRAVGDDGRDEVGDVARAVDIIRERWSTIVRDIRSVADGVVRSTLSISNEARHVVEGSNAQVEAATGAAKKSAGIVDDMQGFKTIVDGVADVSKQSSAALGRAREASRSVAQEMDRMLASIRENDAHRGEVQQGIVAVASACDELGDAVQAAVVPAEQVTRQMIGAVNAANGIADHARAAVAKSGQALSLLEKQRGSADAVALGAEATAKATGALQDAMGEVLNTTALIRDIADMTSMLSLNASIIAAQAGDRALGFGTVADEIRSLAARTRGAVDGIEARTAEARRQLDAMGGVVGSLSETVTASRASTAEATGVVENVLEQMNGALADVAGLAQLVDEAAHETRSARDAVGRIDAELGRIGTALAKQRSAQLRLDESSGQMQKNAGGVRDTGRAQIASTEALIEGMTKLAKATDELVALASVQTKSAKGIAQDTARVKDVAERHKETVDAITQAVAKLDDEARALREAIRSLRVE